MHYKKFSNVLKYKNKLYSILRKSIFISELKKDNLTVLVNGTKEIDLYNYCQSLRIMGKQNSLEIQEVEEEYDSIHSGVARLLVTQISK